MSIIFTVSEMMMMPGKGNLQSSKSLTGLSIILEEKKPTVLLILSLFIWHLYYVCIHSDF